MRFSKTISTQVQTLIDFLKIERASNRFFSKFFRFGDHADVVMHYLSRFSEIKDQALDPCGNSVDLSTLATTDALPREVTAQPIQTNLKCVFINYTASQQDTPQGPNTLIIQDLTHTAFARSFVTPSGTHVLLVYDQLNFRHKKQKRSLKLFPYIVEIEKEKVCEFYTKFHYCPVFFSGGNKTQLRVA